MRNDVVHVLKKIFVSIKLSFSLPAYNCSLRNVRKKLHSISCVGLSG